MTATPHILACLRENAYELTNQLQHEALILEAAADIAKDWGDLCIEWSWNPRQTGSVEEPDLQGEVNGDIVISAEVTTSRRPIGMVDQRMARILKKLSILPCQRIYCVRTPEMRRERKGDKRLNKIRLSRYGDREISIYWLLLVPGIFAAAVIAASLPGPKEDAPPTDRFREEVQVVRRQQQALQEEYLEPMPEWRVGDPWTIELTREGQVVELTRGQAWEYRRWWGRSSGARAADGTVLVWDLVLDNQGILQKAQRGDVSWYFGIMTLRDDGRITLLTDKKKKPCYIE